MLIGIHSALHPDLLHGLASMGHGDEIAIVDRNFPSASVAAQTDLGLPLQLSLGLIEATHAILSVFPIDTFDLERAPVRGMQVVGDPKAVPQIVSDAAHLFSPTGNKVELIERFAFYEAAKSVFMVVRTTEDLPYGNFIIRKGVV